MKMAQEYLLCKDAHRKLHGGGDITDGELDAALKHYRRLVLFLEYLDDRTMKLFMDHISDEFEKLKGFKKARMNKEG